MAGLGQLPRFRPFSKVVRHSSHADRLSGFRKVMQKCNPAVRDEYLKIGDQTIDSGYRSGLDLLRLAEPPTAIIASNSRLLLGLMSSVNELQAPYPEQISIVGFDDLPWTRHLTPPLTVLAQPAHEIGRKALQLVPSKIRAGEGADNEHDTVIQLKADLRIRESTARPYFEAKLNHRAEDFAAQMAVTIEQKTGS